MSRTNPPECSEIDPETIEKVSGCSHDGLKGCIQLGPEKWIMVRTYQKEAEKIYNLKVRPDDVWMLGMPRSGTTMIQDMAWLILNDLDLETFAKVNPHSRTPVLESNVFVEGLSQSATEKDYPMISNIKVSRDILFGDGSVTSIGRGRVIKTHLPFSLIPPEVLTSGCKVVYVARNPKDVIVSSFHLIPHILPQFEFIKTFDQFLELYLNDLVLYGPYWKHIEQAWEKRHLPNFKFVFYENNTKYLRRTVEEMAEFLEVKLTTSQIDELTKIMTFDEYKKLRPSALAQKPSDQQQARKGKVGGYKELMSEEVTRKVDEWIEENCKKIGIEFPVV